MTRALPLCLLFWVLDLTYFGACLGKIATGGWFPLAMALIIVIVMVTWWDGWKALAIKVMTKTIPKDQFVERIALEKPIRQPGSGVFLSSFHKEVPPMLLHYLTQTRALPEKLVILSILTSDVPYVEESERVETKGLGHGIYRVTAHTGFMETPDVPQILAQARKLGVDIDLEPDHLLPGAHNPGAGPGQKPVQVAAVSVYLYAQKRGERLHLHEHPPGQRAGDRRADGILIYLIWGGGPGSSGSLPSPHTPLPTL